MQFLLLAITFFAALTSALKLNDLVSRLPPCSHLCFAQQVPATGCDFLDQGCQCKPETKKALTSSLTPCIVASCGLGANAFEVLAITNELCALESQYSYTLALTKSIEVPASVYSAFNIPTTTMAPDYNMAAATAAPMLGAALVAGVAGLAL